VPTETLRGLLTGLGCTQVQTLLTSGNAVFQAPGPASAARATVLAAALRRELTLEVPVSQAVTTRNWATTLKNQALLQGLGQAPP